MEKAIIRNAKISDAKNILKIYSYYVEKTAISFEYITPTIKEFKTRMKEFMKNFPFLVLILNEKIIGYAYAHEFIKRAAYNHCCELTIYIDKNHKKCGYGRQLYELLEKKLKELGYLNLYACVGVPLIEDKYLTNNSKNFHEHLGFKTIGTFYKCGYKFNNWYNMIWMEKIIGEHSFINNK